MNLTMDELRWYRYQCNECGRMYKSTSQRSICPGCRSENVVNVQETGS